MDTTLLALLLVLLLLGNSSIAQGQEEQFPSYQRILNMAAVPLFAIPLVHESGHGLFALIAGADSVSIHPFSFLPYETHSLNLDVPHYNVKSGLIFSGGAITTRLTSELINILLNNTKPPRWVVGVGGGLSTMLRVDLPVQYLWGLTYAVFSPSKGMPDFDGIVKNLFETSLLKTIFYIVSGVIIATDIYFSWNSIQRNFNRAVGRGG